VSKAIVNLSRETSIQFGLNGSFFEGLWLQDVCHPAAINLTRRKPPLVPNAALALGVCFRPKEDVHRSAQCRTAASLDRSLVQRATFL